MAWLERLQDAMWCCERSTGLRAPEALPYLEKGQLWLLPGPRFTYLFHEVTEVRRAMNAKLYLRAIRPTYFPSIRATPTLYI